MKSCRIALTALAAILVAGAAAWGQAPGGTTTQGFTVEALISQLSLYLPEESTQGLGGFGGRGFGGGQAGQGAGAQAGAAQPGTGQGAGAQGQGAQNFRQLLQFTRDPKLYLTKDQITKLLPILMGLKENPLPTPSKAKQVQAGVDGILTVAQKAEYTAYQKQMEKAIEEIRKQFAASGSNGGTFQRAEGTGQGQGTPGGQQRAAQGAQMTPTERRQRELDAFIKVLQDRLKQVST